jgi:DHA2 family multidrug resistance protein
MRSFGLSCLLIFLMGAALYGSSALLPLMLQSQFGYDATLAGLVLSPGGIAVIFLMPVSGKLVSKIQARYLAALGFSLCAIGMYATMKVTPESDYRVFVTARILQVLGLPFLFIPLSTLAFMQVPKEKNSKASALFALARNLGGSIGIALIATYVSRHQQIHQAYLSPHLSPYNPVYNDLLGHMKQTLIGIGQPAFAATQSAMGRLYQELQHQSGVMAYHDGFLLLCIVMVTAACSTFLLPRNNPGKKAVAAVH